MPHRLAPFQFLLQLSSNSFSTRTRLLFLFPPIRITRTINPSFSLFLGERARWKCRRIFGESVSSSLKNRNEALQLFFETRGAIDTRKRNCWIGRDENRATCKFKGIDACARTEASVNREGNRSLGDGFHGQSCTTNQRFNSSSLSKYGVGQRYPTESSRDNVSRVAPYILRLIVIH